MPPSLSKSREPPHISNDEEELHAIHVELHLENSASMRGETLSVKEFMGDKTNVPTEEDPYEYREPWYPKPFYKPWEPGHQEWQPGHAGLDLHRSPSEPRPKISSPRFQPGESYQTSRRNLAASSLPTSRTLNSASPRGEPVKSTQSGPVSKRGPPLWKQKFDLIVRDFLVRNFDPEVIQGCLDRGFHHREFPPALARKSNPNKGRLKWLVKRKLRKLDQRFHSRFSKTSQSPEEESPPPIFPIVPELQKYKDSPERAPPRYCPPVPAQKPYDKYKNPAGRDLQIFLQTAEEFDEHNRIQQVNFAHRAASDRWLRVQGRKQVFDELIGRASPISWRRINRVVETAVARQRTDLKQVFDLKNRPPPFQLVEVDLGTREPLAGRNYIAWDQTYLASKSKPLSSKDLTPATPWRSPPSPPPTDPEEDYYNIEECDVATVHNNNLSRELLQGPDSSKRRPRKVTFQSDDQPVVNKSIVVNGIKSILKRPSPPSKPLEQEAKAFRTKYPHFRSLVKLREQLIRSGKFLKHKKEEPEEPIKNYSISQSIFNHNPNVSTGPPTWTKETQSSGSSSGRNSSKQTTSKEPSSSKKPESSDINCGKQINPKGLPAFKKSNSSRINPEEPRATKKAASAFESQRIEHIEHQKQVLSQPPPALVRLPVVELLQAPSTAKSYYFAEPPEVEELSEDSTSEEPNPFADSERKNTSFVVGSDTDSSRASSPTTRQQFVRNPCTPFKAPAFPLTDRGTEAKANSDKDFDSGSQGKDSLISSSFVLDPEPDLIGSVSAGQASRGRSFHLFGLPTLSAEGKLVEAKERLQEDLDADSYELEQLPTASKSPVEEPSSLGNCPSTEPNPFLDDPSSCGYPQLADVESNSGNDSSEQPAKDQSSSERQLFIEDPENRSSWSCSLREDRLAIGTSSPVEHQSSFGGQLPTKDNSSPEERPSSEGGSLSEGQSLVEDRSSSEEPIPTKGNCTSEDNSSLENQLQPEDLQARQSRLSATFDELLARSADIRSQAPYCAQIDYPTSRHSPDHSNTSPVPLDKSQCINSLSDFVQTDCGYIPYRQALAEGARVHCFEVLTNTRPNPQLQERLRVPSSSFREEDGALLVHGIVVPKERLTARLVSLRQSRSLQPSGIGRPTCQEVPAVVNPRYPHSLRTYRHYPSYSSVTESEITPIPVELDIAGAYSEKEFFERNCRRIKADQSLSSIKADSGIFGAFENRNLTALKSESGISRGSDSEFRQRGEKALDEYQSRELPPIPPIPSLPLNETPLIPQRLALCVQRAADSSASSSSDLFVAEGLKSPQPLKCERPKLIEHLNRRNPGRLLQVGLELSSLDENDSDTLSVSQPEIVVSQVEDVSKPQTQQQNTDLHSPSFHPATSQASSFHERIEALEIKYCQHSALESASYLRLSPLDIMDNSRLSTRSIQYSSQRAQQIEDARQMQQTVFDAAKKAGKDPPKYTLLQLIGKGAFGRVYKGKDMETAAVVAIKTIDIDESDSSINPRQADAYGDFLKEVNALTALSEIKARNINHVIEALPVGKSMWMITEYCAGGSVSTLMHPTKPGGLQERWIIPILREVSEAIRWVHSVKIIHRDIKCGNVLVTEQGGVQLCDFGISSILDSKLDKRKTVIGTPNWMAPELFDGRVIYGQDIDIWAFGAMVYEIATGFPPNAGLKFDDIGTKLKKSAPRLEGGNYSNELRDLIAYCMEEIPSARPSIDDVEKHPYIYNTSSRYPTSSLAGLVRAYKMWEDHGGSRKSLFMAGGAQGPAELNSNAFEGEWNFSTTAAFDQQVDRDSNPQDVFDAYGTSVELDTSFAQGRTTPQKGSRRRPPPQALAPIRHPLEKVFDQRTMSNYNDNSREQYGISEQPYSDLPLRDDTAQQPTRESLIDLGGHDPSTGVSSFNDMDTIKVGRRGRDENVDDYSSTSQNFNRPALSDPEQVSNNRRTQDWKFPTMGPPASADPEVSRFPSSYNPSQPAMTPDSGGRPTLVHHPTEPIGSAFGGISSSTALDRMSMSSLIDLDMSVPDPVDFSARPSTANSDVGSVTSELTSSRNPFEFEKHASRVPPQYDGADDPTEPEIYITGGGTSARLRRDSSFRDMGDVSDFSASDAEGPYRNGDRPRYVSEVSDSEYISMPPPPRPIAQAQPSQSSYSISHFPDLPLPPSAAALSGTALDQEMSVEFHRMIDGLTGQLEAFRDVYDELKPVTVTRRPSQRRERDEAAAS